MCERDEDNTEQSKEHASSGECTRKETRGDSRFTEWEKKRNTVLSRNVFGVANSSGSRKRETNWSKVDQNAVLALLHLQAYKRKEEDSKAKRSDT